MRVGLEMNRPSRHGLGQFERFGTEPAESFFDSAGSVPNWSPNQFNGLFDSAHYLLGQFAGFILTRTSFKN
jgi:hypothetical protein